MPARHGSTNRLLHIITSPDPAVRNLSIDSLCASASVQDLLAECDALDSFRLASDNLYHRVRACFFLYAIYRFHLPGRPEMPARGHIPFEGYVHLLERRFEEAATHFRKVFREDGPSDALCSALAEAYHALGFQTLADQVRRSVRSVRGNQWMFRSGHAADMPLRVRPELARPSENGAFPTLREATPVRMDLTHSGWSDIFFLGMDYPEGARVINVSIDLAVRGRDRAPRPPVEAYFRVIDEPVIRLTSVDLETSSDLHTIAEVFDFAKDYLGLLKAALIASGLVPPGMEGSEQPLQELLARLVLPGHGLELVSCVNGIPKGSRLAVSTNLLAALITACMRATGQFSRLEGGLEEPERRLVAARAILGEWLAGSGGGWQDSGGVWPGIKLIEGQAATQDDPEWGISRGRLLPRHTVLDESRASCDSRRKMQESLVLVHGGMAQNVGPILEMVTEKYLLRSEKEWTARQAAGAILNEILCDLQRGDIKAIGEATTRNFEGPIQAIIPWATNLYTETLIREAGQAFGPDFWGFWMLGGMSGGGMGFIFDPRRKQEAQDRLQEIMSATRQRLDSSLPFAMDPVVYDFAINDRGTWATLLDGSRPCLPPAYYAFSAPRLIRMDPRSLPASRRAELHAFGVACKADPDMGAVVQTVFERLVPRPPNTEAGKQSLRAMLEANGFDPIQHAAIRQDLRLGRIGLAQNRLPVNVEILDAQPDQLLDGLSGVTEAHRKRGLQALAEGRVGVVSLAAGAGTRWTQGAGVVKALHPFARLAGRHRTFVEMHLAKSRHTGDVSGTPPAHVLTTSYLTHQPISDFLAAEERYGYSGPLRLSPGRNVGLRMVPTVRDLRYAWEEMPQQMLDPQAQKVRESLHAALIEWARSTGEATDYTDNVPSQCLHPVGHWYEVPNLLKNGTLLALLQERPGLEHLMVHNIDTAGANLDPGILGLHLEQGGALTIEVVPRRLEDRGGGLAVVDGRLRLVEGLALPREEVEFQLSYYNSLTTWVHIPRLLELFRLKVDDISNEARVTEAVRAVAARMPTYVTLKDVKRRWGHGQEDVFPVAQFEKLWGDMSSLPELPCRFMAVSRLRGQQLKEQSQLDGWLRDGSAAYVESLCRF